MAGSEREEGYYWVRQEVLGWIVAEWSCDSWQYGTDPLADSAIVEIGERCVREPSIEYLQNQLIAATVRPVLRRLEAMAREGRRLPDGFDEKEGVRLLMEALNGK